MTVSKEEKYLKLDTSDQDFKQKLSMTTTLILEFYRVLMGSLLVLLVPQACDDHVCSFNENLFRKDDIALTAVVFNFMNIISMGYLYYTEIVRETTMIDCLDVNIHKARDNTSVGKELDRLPKDTHQCILKLDSQYLYAGYGSIAFFTLNLIISCISIFEHYLDSKTLTVLLTNVLFMGSKLSDVITTVNTDENIFLSAYLTRKIQYNDADKDVVNADKDVVNADKKVINKKKE